jgi:hypothetical protein
LQLGRSCMRHVAALQPDKSSEKIWSQELLQRSLSSETELQDYSNSTFISLWLMGTEAYTYYHEDIEGSYHMKNSVSVLAEQAYYHYHYQTQFLLQPLSFRFMLLMQSVNL